jgi:arylsulfatase A-like enzyme
MPLEHLPKRPNIVLIITDQEREVRHWPDGWAEANLPARSRLMEHGMQFTNAYCNSATCSPSRATLLTGLYSARHGVKTLLQSNDPQNKAQNRLPVLPPHLPNLARVLEAEGYHVVYKGKFHLSRPVKYNALEKRHAWSGADVEHMAETYGFHEWNPPDMGDPTSINNFGGGDTNNDGRFVDGSGTAAGRDVRREDQYEQSAVGFLNNYTGDKPFCLVVSLVGPHDVQAYPGRGVTGLGRKPLYARAGYELAAFEHLPIDAPPTVAENITTKPSAHRSIRRFINLVIGKSWTPRQQRTHARFYAYLCKEVDRQILKVLDALDANGLTEDTLIVRTADHGELAMSHGGMVEKFYNAYQESINVPLIFSNPKLFPEGRTTDALAALVDVVPTLAVLVGAQDPAQFQGQDLTPILADPAASVKDCVHFTSDDDTWPVRGGGPGNIRAIVEKDWKYAVYYDPFAGAEPEYEMYDLKNDPFEVINLAHEENWDPKYADERRRLHQRLGEVMDQHGTRPAEIQWPAADDFAPEAPYKRETKRLYASDIIIEAPLQTVWDTFTDLPRLGEWNPLLTAIEGELGLGQRLQVHIASMPRPVEASVIRYNPPFELQWLDTIPGGAMTPHFGIQLEAVGENRTRFIVQESFEGRLVGIAGRRLDRTMPAQYEAMCQALKARVEGKQVEGVH